MSWTALPSAGGILYASTLSALITELRTQVMGSDNDDTSRTTTSTSFTSTLSAAHICGVSFVAPATGIVEINWSAAQSNSGAGFCSTSFAVSTGSTVGSGTAFQAAGFSTSLLMGGTSEVSCGKSRLVTGLTGGSTYNVFLSHAVGSGTGSFRYRNVSVKSIMQ